MNALEKSIYQEINEKLKDAPKEILDRVLGYIEGILEIEQKDFHLTKKQMLELDEMENKPLHELNFSNSGNVHSRLKEKYGI